MDKDEFIRRKLPAVRYALGSMEDLDDDRAMEYIREEVLSDEFCKGLCYEEIRHIIEVLFYKTRRRLGILDPLIRDPAITEIMVNGPRDIFIEKKGRIEKYDCIFDTVEELEEVLMNVAGDVHREINEMNPIVDARLPNGSRVNGVYKNVAVNGPILTIRKFSTDFISMKKLVENRTLTESGARLLALLVECGYNIFVSGGTSSGKTTLLNALAEAVPKDERVIVIEDSMELKLPYIENIVHMECRTANSGGAGSVNMSQLIKSSLRMRPDRIIVGEVRGAEVMDMLQAMNTGHSGSLSTGHGNSVKGMLRRLESLYLMAAPLDIDAIRGQIAEGIDIMVHLEKIGKGERRVVEIYELLRYEKGEFQLNKLMGLDGNMELRRMGDSLLNSKRIILKGEEYAYRLQELGFIL